MQSRFAQLERERHARLISGLEWGRFERDLFQGPPQQVLRDVQFDHQPGLMLSANSYQGRLRWHRAFARHLVMVVGPQSPGLVSQRDVHLLTLVDDTRCLTEAQERPAMKSLRHGFGSCLTGLNFVGMLEPALYVSVPFSRSTSRRLYAWHFHAIVWDASAEDIQKVRTRVREHQFSSLIPRAPALDITPVPLEDVLDVAGYINKSPRHQYSLAHILGGTRIQQYRRKATGANLARLHRHLEGLHLDDLAVAGGEGTDVLRAIKAEALSAWRDFKRRQRHESLRGMRAEVRVRGGSYAGLISRRNASYFAGADLLR